MGFSESHCLSFRPSMLLVFLEYLLRPGPREWAGMAGPLSPLGTQPCWREVDSRQYHSCLVGAGQVLIPALPLTGPVTLGKYSSNTSFPQL